MYCANAIEHSLFFLLFYFHPHSSDSYSRDACHKSIRIMYTPDEHTLESKKKNTVNKRSTSVCSISSLYLIIYCNIDFDFRNELMKKETKKTNWIMRRTNNPEWMHQWMDLQIGIHLLNQFDIKIISFHEINGIFHTFIFIRLSRNLKCTKSVLLS